MNQRHFLLAFSGQTQCIAAQFFLTPDLNFIFPALIENGKRADDAQVHTARIMLHVGVRNPCGKDQDHAGGFRQQVVVDGHQTDQ